MGLFTGQRSFAADPRIQMVERVEDIPRCGSPFRRAHGVLCPLPLFTPDEKLEVIDFMKPRMVQEPAIFAENYKGFNRGKLPPALSRSFDELASIFQRATHQDHCLVFMRANSSHPQAPHRHSVTLTYTFTGEGTVGINKKGEPYSVPQDHVFIFDRIPHMASQSFTGEDIKLTIIAG